jgi:hypothetical protein
VDYISSLVDDNYRARKKSFEWAVNKSHSIVGVEFAAPEGGEICHVLNSLSVAKTLLSER